jgi:hypothetical protein
VIFHSYVKLPEGNHDLTSNRIEPLGKKLTINGWMFGGVPIFRTHMGFAGV